jgi:NAD(P)-dependent dehydrogenase (short-subunit alcohol dehydrogenase family)
VLEGVDTTDTDKLKAAAAELRKHTDSIDILYNNAGVSHGGGLITGVTAQQLRDNFEGNVVGPHNVLLEFSPFVLASKAERRSILITSSLLGSVDSMAFIKEWSKGAGLPGLVTGAYATSK